MNTKTQEALKMAKEALIFYGIGIVRDNSLAYAAHKAIDEALESQEQEPVAWGQRNNKGKIAFVTLYKDEYPNNIFEPLYTHPAQPLSAAQAGALFRKDMTPHEFCRAIEKAHGIE